MAFLPHPTLPVRTARSMSHSVAIPTRVDERPAVVVGRRRRVYGVLSVQPASQTGTSARVDTVCSGSKRDEVRRALLQQIQQRNEELKESNTKCEMRFREELEALRTPLPAPEPPAVPKAIQHDTTPGLGTTPELPSAPERELLAAPVQPELLPQAPQREQIAGAPEPAETADEPDTAATQNTGVEELYSPPSSEPKVEPKEEPILERAFHTITRTVETIVEEARDNIEDVMESLTEPKEQIPKDSKKEDGSSTKPEEEGPESKERSIGKVLLDAIVDGVPSKPKEGKASQADKSELIFLVDSGKIKNLTVSKLRRLLSANNLKTSGRKAELIARLTSFAKK